MPYENNDLYSKRLKAGKRRTYFFDVRTTRANDYFLTITESKKRFDDNGYERHKIFLYKEDFNKFINALEDAVDHVKTELLPDFDFDQFSHEDDDEEHQEFHKTAESTNTEEPVVAEALSEPEEVSSESESGGGATANEQVDKW